MRVLRRLIAPVVAAVALAVCTQSLAVTATFAAPALIGSTGSATNGGAQAALNLARQLLTAKASASEVQRGLAALKQAAAGGLPEASLRLGDAYASGAFGLSRDLQEALANYRRAAEAGNATAWTKLGNLYLSGGPGLPADPASAASLFAQAADRGDNGGREALARLLLDGTGVPRNPDRAIAVLHQAIAAGDSYAAVLLGNAYRTGRGVAVDGARAVGLLEPLATQNNVPALNALGDLYRAGAGAVARDPARAMALYRQAADLSDTGAKKKIAEMMIKGEIGPADFAGGVALIKTLADGGDASALALLGDDYARSDYGHPDGVQAEAYFREAAAAGLASAYTRLGNLYKGGAPGLPADPLKAVAPYEQAITLGDNGGREALARMLLDGTGVAKDPDRAVKLLNDAAAEGDSNALVVLANAYAGGRGVTRDMGKAIALLEPLTSLNQPAALNSLGDLYRSGAVGLARDPGKAVSLYEQAAAGGDNGARKKIGDMLIRGEGGPTNFTGGIRRVQQAVDAGDATALLQLGDYYARPDYGHPDVAKAERFYEQAADTGVAAGFTRLGNLYRVGAPGLRPDPAKAVGYFQRAIAKGDNNAREAWATLSLDRKSGQYSPHRALAVLNDAVAAGDANAALMLSQMYANGQGIAPSYGQARAMTDRATQLGSATAQLRLGSALVNGPLARGHRREGLSLIAAAAAGKVPGAAVQLALNELRGKVRGKAAPQAIAQLRSAVADGQVDALRYLIQLYRGGYGTQIDRSPTRALELITANAGLLGEGGAAVERLLVAATPPLTPDRFRHVAQSFAQLPAPLRLQALQQLRTVSPAAATALLQGRLWQLGYYKGPVTGEMTAATERGVIRACGATAASQCGSAADEQTLRNIYGLVVSDTFARAGAAPIALAVALTAKPQSGSAQRPGSVPPGPGQVADAFLSPSGGACAGTGPMALAGVTTDWKTIRPSTRKYLAGVWRTAELSGCLPRVLCVASSSAKDDMAAAAKMCGVASGALIQNVLPARRSVANRAVQRKTVLPSAQYPAGSVYLALAPGIVDYSQVVLTAPTGKHSLVH